jgi:molybdate-binding protein/DNA-binding XRE family transcriptional regulator
MTTHPVKQAREARGMSQLDLAASAKLTRQSIGAIESGRSTPSVDVALRLAKILDRSVEELFEHTTEADTVVAEPARPFVPGRLALAHIAGRWVAHSLQRDGLRVAADAISTGQGTRAVQAQLLRAASEARANTLIAGCALGLGLLTDRLSPQRGAGRYVALSCSSTVALEALARNHVHVAGVHLVDAKSGNANVADVRRIVRKTELVLITLARWEMGLVIAPDQARRIRGPADLVRRGLRVAVREEGSGARRLLDQQLRGLGVATLSGALVTTGHLEVAQAVAIGAADTGIATRDAAISFGLHFVPIMEERYDLAMRAQDEQDPRIQRLLNALNTRALCQELSCLGYDVSQAGARVAQLSAA